MSHESTATVRVKSSNPEHTGGYFVKNAGTLRDDEEMFDAPAKTQTGDQFDAMDKDALKAYLTEKAITFHHMTGEAKLRDLCREHAESEQV